MKKANIKIQYAQIVSDVLQWCNSIGFSDCISEIARCVRSQMYLCGVGETALSHPTMKTICDAIAAASLYKEIEADGVAKRAQPYKAQNAAMRWAEKVATDYPFFDEITTMDAALKFAEGKTAAGNEREGVVLKTCDDGPFASCKIINNNYLLKQKD